MTTDASPGLWAITFAIGAVMTVLRALIALNKWNGTRFYMLKKQGRGSNIVAAMLTFGVTVLCALGLSLSLS